jgi:hypothetical protein
VTTNSRVAIGTNGSNLGDLAVNSITRTSLSSDDLNIVAREACNGSNPKSALVESCKKSD